MAEDNPTETPETPETSEKTDADKVKKDTEELKAANDEYDKERLRAETIRAEKARGGEANNGQPTPTASEELAEKAKAEAQEIVDAFR